MRRPATLALLCAALALSLPVEAADAPLPLRAADLLGSFGVNIHMAYTDTAYADVAKVRAALTYTGLRHLRNLVLTGAIDPAGRVHLDRLVAGGNDRIDFVANDPDLGRAMAWLDLFAARFPGVVAAVEGPNEVDNWPIGYGGKTGREAAVDYQRDLYRAVHTAPRLAGVPVYALTGLGNGWSGDLSAIMDAANQHPYARNGMPPSAHLLIEIAQTHQATAPSRPMVVTETGYPTLLHHPEISFGKDGVSEAVQASFILDLLLDFKKAGVARTYLYELLDEKPDPDGKAIDQHYGLFAFDGTPKASARALHNLSEILRDPGADAASFAPAPVTATIEGLPASGNTLAVRKSDGSVQLIAWAEPRIWDPATSTAAPAPERRATLRFGPLPRRVRVYDPTVGTAPIAEEPSAAQISVSVSDHPIVVDLSAAAP